MFHRIIFIAILLVSSVAQAQFATGKAKPNALYNHASPYLAMHGRDPVRWQVWNKETVARAKRENKLLFVSSGYFSCHWCHVMQRESYQNKEIATYLNKYFIPVKVDRELNSALDAHLINFIQQTQGYSGWPLNAFVTPGGYPLVGMVYVPPDNFKQVLVKLGNEWKSNSNSLKRLAKAASAELSPGKVSSSHILPKGLGKKLVQQYLNQLFSRTDDLQGGFGQQNKFPSVPQLDALLDIYSSQANQHRQDVKKFLVLTLKQMANLGLRDQLGGGFYRYVVDPGWQVPHFEKMLYDNALLASLYYKAGRLFKDPYYITIADDTIEFMLREMGSKDGMMVASLSAVDNKGIEGGYYLWGTGRLSSLLTKNEWKVIKLFWQLEGPPDLEGGHHLVQAMALGQAADALEMKTSEVASLIESARNKMLKVRGKRVIPVDIKKLTAWNGLALSALVSGASNNKKFMQAAAKLADFLQTQVWNDKQLSRAIGSGGIQGGMMGTLGKGNLEDYAYTIRGLYDWWRINKSAATEKVLQKMIQQAWKRFFTRHGWLLAEDMLLRYGQADTVIADGPLPSPSAVLINVTLEFAKITHDKDLEKQALRALNSGRDEIMDDAFWFPTQIRTIAGLTRISHQGAR